ncbi:MAG: hypothetical protein EOP48_34870, partial [Sphingobacteriales bacterium]
NKGLKVVVVGDVKEAEILPKLAFLNKLPNKAVAIPKVAATPMPANESQIYLVDIPKAAQTEFRVGYNTGLKFDATGEYYRASLLNYALGGDFNSRLNLNLREDKGWTYGARSSFSGDEYDGDFKFSSGIKAEATDSALSEVIKEIRNYASGGITEDELAFMKNAIGQRDARAYETGIQKAGFIRMILDYNLPANYTATQAKILQNMTKKEMDALIRKHISADKMNMLLVGDKPIMEHNLDQLARYGIDDFWFSINYLGDQIETYFGSGENKNVSIQYIREDVPLGTIGSVSKIKNFTHDYILVSNSDLLTNLDYEMFFLDFISHDADLAIVTIP